MTHRPYSFAQDQSVPAYNHTRALIVFDEVCVLCNGFVQFVLRHDRQEKFLFTSAQGELGQALYVHFQLPTDEFETNLVIVDGVMHEKLYAFVAVMVALGGLWKVALILKILPRPLANWLYDRIAKNRYAVFGKYDTCHMPSAELQARLI